MADKLGKGWALTFGRKLVISYRLFRQTGLYYDAFHEVPVSATSSRSHQSFVGLPLELRGIHDTHLSVHEPGGDSQMKNRNHHGRGDEMRKFLKRQKLNIPHSIHRILFCWPRPAIVKWTATMVYIREGKGRSSLKSSDKSCYS